jgi:hypothetical protein
MRYNEKYDRYVDDDLVIYRWDKTKDKLVQCSIFNCNGYSALWTKLGIKKVHRVLWETFKYEIPEGYEIDHINTIKTDNRLENLRCVTHLENNNNPLTIKHRSESLKGKPSSNKGKTFSEEHRRKISLSNKGKKHTLESRQKMSQALKGKPSPRKGVTLSEETKKRISKSHIVNSKSDFGKKYIEHFGYGRYENQKQYHKEQEWYRRHNKCRWE